MTTNECRCFAFSEGECACGNYGRREAADRANLRMQYKASQEALSRCLTENRENRQAADHRLNLLRAVVSFVDANGADLPLTLLESIRVELSTPLPNETKGDE